jgi:hypothetical protein
MARRPAAGSTITAWVRDYASDLIFDYTGLITPVIVLKRVAIRQILSHDWHYLAHDSMSPSDSGAPGGASRIQCSVNLKMKAACSDSAY